LIGGGVEWRACLWVRRGELMGLLKGMMGLERKMEGRLSRLAWIGMATVLTMNMDAIEKRVAVP
jgi:hypothetical protein